MSAPSPAVPPPPPSPPGPPDATVARRAAAALTAASVAAGAVVVVPLLFARAVSIDVALDAVGVDRLVALVVAAGVLGALAASGARHLAAARDLLVAASGVAGVAGLALAAVNDADALVGLLFVSAAAAGAVWALARVVAGEVAGGDGAWVTMVMPWAGSFGGAALVAVVQALRFFPNWGYVAGGAGAVALVAAVGVAVDVPAVAPARSTPTVGLPALGAEVWLLAFAFGAATIGVVPTALRHVATRWAMDPRAVGALAFAVTGAAALAVATGHWFHGLDRSDAPGSLVAGVVAVIATAGLVTVGGASTTWIGVVVSWSGAGAAAGLAVLAVERAVVVAAPTHLRYHRAAALVGAAAAGATTALIGAAAAAGTGRGWVIAGCCLPALVVGVVVLTSLEGIGSAAGRGAAGPGATGAGASGRWGRTSAVALHDPLPVSARLVASGRRPLLEVDGLDVAYDRVQVLFGASLVVGEGELVALIGTNGAGKTTFLRALSGLVRPSGGAVHFAGVDIGGYDPTWRVALGLSQIAAGQAIAPGLTVGENLRMFGHTVDGTRHRAGLHHAWEVFPRLKEREHQPTSTLSGGEQQMLSLAKAMILRPRLLLIDEFSLGLAPKIVGELLPVVAQLNAEGTAVLLVEQSVNIALSLASHAYCMEKGRVVLDADAAALAADPAALQAAYFGGAASIGVGR